MRFASFCALAGTALLAGHVVVANIEEVGGMNIDIEGLAADAGLEIPEVDEKTVAGFDASSPEVLEGLTLTSEDQDAVESAEGQVFQAEVSRMMKLIINSIYKNKEIFLRELISNASDALDKIRLKALTNRSGLDTDLELRVRIRADRANNILHIEDTGIGMTKDDLVTNLGTIAKSGTADFMEKIEAGGAEASSLIGQFGVGFYSAFLVADKIVVTSKADGDDQHVWTSDSTAFSIIKDPRGNTLTRGTRISLYMKPEAYDFLQEATLDNLVSRYSEFIDFPIYSWTEIEREVEASDDSVIEGDEEGADDAEEEGADEEEDDEEGDVDEYVEEEDNEEVEMEKVWDYKHMNPQRPIWTRDPKDVEKEEYNNFYKSFARNDFAEPLGYTHFKADGTEVGFKSILFIPSASFIYNEQEQMGKEMGKNIRLFVRRVFITEDLGEFMPRYLWFVKGMIDSDDLSLNLSRETLQAHKLLKVIKKKVVRKTLEMFKSLAENNPESYLDFYNTYKSNLKIGIIEDTANRGRLANLLRFETSKTDGVPISLETYVENMKEGQRSIYYLPAGSIDECKTSPLIEQLKKQGLEVLYMVDPVDEYTIRALPEYKGIQFMNAAKEIKFDDETEDNEARKQHFEELDIAFKATTDFLRSTYGHVVSKVVVSTRLDESPCILVTPEIGMSGNMQRILESQMSKTSDPAMDYYMSQKKTLEINSRHPLIKKLRSLVDSGETTAATADLAVVLLDTALMRSGFKIQDEVAFSARIERMLRLSMGVDLNEPVEDMQEFEANPVVDDEVDDAEDVAADAEEEERDEL